MFDVYLVNYLLKKNIISNQQYRTISKVQRSSRVKLGLIAVSKKLLTNEQAEEINFIQGSQDKLFGDIAIELGYLTVNQVGKLLVLQSNSYLKLAQTLVDYNMCSLSDFETYVKAYQQDNAYTDQEMEYLKSDDITCMLPILLKIDVSTYLELISLTIRNIIRFIDTQVFVDHCYITKRYHAESISCQEVTGDHTIFLGFSGKRLSLLSIANPYAAEDMTSVTIEAFDAVCEFINCINGLFATKLSMEQIALELLPPTFNTNLEITSEEIYVVPLIINNEAVDLIVSIDHDICIQKKGD